MFRRASFQVLIAFVLFSCASSPDDKWYNSPDTSSNASHSVDLKADSLARALCGCMSGVMASAMGEAEFESMLVDLEKLVALPAHERAAQEAELEQKYARLAGALESLGRMENQQPPQCMADLNPRMTALENAPDGRRTQKAMADLLNTNCRVMRLMIAMKND